VSYSQYVSCTTLLRSSWIFTARNQMIRNAVINERAALSQLASIFELLNVVLARAIDKGVYELRDCIVLVWHVIACAQASTIQRASPSALRWQCHRSNLHQQQQLLRQRQHRQR
jgi:hypothetical protein